MKVPQRRSVLAQQTQQVINTFTAPIVVPDQCVRGHIVSVKGQAVVVVIVLHLVLNGEWACDV